MNTESPSSQTSPHNSPRALLPPVQDATMWAYPWDLADEGYGDALERMKESGLTGVSVASAYHAGKFLSPHNPNRKVVFLEDGVVYFQPRPELYDRLKPAVSELVREGHGLARVVREAEKHGLRTNAWVVCCHNTRIGTAYPDVTCENAFGDKLLHTLCPSNGDVRRYLAALVKDVADQGVRRIELEALQFLLYAHGFHHEREGIVLNPAMTFLLGLCFCLSCRLRAASVGIDLTAIANFTRGALADYFAHPEPEGGKYEDIDDLPQEMFIPFLAWRMEIIRDLVQELQIALWQSDAVLRPMAYPDPIQRMLTGNESAAIAPITGGVLALGYKKEGEELRKPLGEFVDHLAPHEVIVGMQVGMPESGGRKEFLDRMRVARELGIVKFNFYNYGFIPLENFEWIREAVG